jgi:hypothetical protein
MNCHAVECRRSVHSALISIGAPRKASLPNGR